MNREAVTVEKIIHGGFGLARCSSGEVLLIPGALPGEHLIVNRGRKKKNYSFAVIGEILTAHRQRRLPPCPQVAAGCGGCDLQHARYRLQQELKRDILNELLRRQSPELAEEATTVMRPLLAAPQEFGCRQRLRLAVTDGRVGFYRSRSKEVVEVNHCLLTPQPLNDVLALLCRHGRALLTVCSEVELLWDQVAAETVLLLHLRRRPRPADRAGAHELSSALGGLRVFFVGADFPFTAPLASSPQQVEQSRQLGIRCNGIEYSFEAGGFCQTNLAQNERLVETVLSFAAIDSGKTVLDLYCGMGNFSVPLALAGARVTAIEGQGCAVRSARRNAANAGVGELCSFRKAPVHTAVPALAEAGATFDLIVIDPPRSGAPKLAKDLAAMTSQLIYVSCDPATLARDLAALREEDFRLCAVQPIDMFPQTSHLETVCSLQRP